jgi:hypothetical protein
VADTTKMRHIWKQLVIMGKDSCHNSYCDNSYCDNSYYHNSYIHNSYCHNSNYHNIYAWVVAA